MNNPTLGGSCTARMTRADSDVSNRVVDVFELNTPTINGPFLLREVAQLRFERFSTISCVPFLFSVSSISGQTFEAMQGLRLASASPSLRLGNRIVENLLL